MHNRGTLHKAINPRERKRERDRERERKREKVRGELLISHDLIINSSKKKYFLYKLTAEWSLSVQSIFSLSLWIVTDSTPAIG